MEGGLRAMTRKTKLKTTTSPLEYRRKNFSTAPSVTEIHTLGRTSGGEGWAI